MIALLFVTATTVANNDKLSLETKKESTSLVFEMDTKKDTAIKLFDAENHVIFSESISEMSYAKRFNLKNLANGLYYFTTEDALRKVVYTISVKGDVVKIVSKKENTKPVFRTADRMVYVNLLNLSKKDVDIKVYDSSNRTIFSEKRIDEMNIQKAINFNDAHNDSYTVVVKDCEDTYYKEITID